MQSSARSEVPGKVGEDGIQGVRGGPLILLPS